MDGGSNLGKAKFSVEPFTTNTLPLTSPLVGGSIFTYSSFNNGFGPHHAGLKVIAKALLYLLAITTASELIINVN